MWQTLVLLDASKKSKLAFLASGVDKVMDPEGSSNQKESLGLFGAGSLLYYLRPHSCPSDALCPCHSLFFNCVGP